MREACLVNPHTERVRCAQGPGESVPARQKESRCAFHPANRTGATQPKGLQTSKKVQSVDATLARSAGPQSTISQGLALRFWDLDFWRMQKHSDQVYWAIRPE